MKLIIESFWVLLKLVRFSVISGKVANISLLLSLIKIISVDLWIRRARVIGKSDELKSSHDTIFDFITTKRRLMGLCTLSWSFYRKMKLRKIFWKLIILGSYTVYWFRWSTLVYQPSQLIFVKQTHHHSITILFAGFMFYHS